MMIAENTTFSPTGPERDETAPLAGSENSAFSEKKANEANAAGVGLARRRSLEDRQLYLAHIFEAQRRFGE